MQAMADKNNGYGANLPVALACISPRLRVSKSNSARQPYRRHVCNVGDVLAAVELNCQALIVFTIKWRVKVCVLHNFQTRAEE